MLNLPNPRVQLIRALNEGGESVLELDDDLWLLEDIRSAPTVQSATIIRGRRLPETMLHLTESAPSAERLQRELAAALLKLPVEQLQFPGHRDWNLWEPTNRLR